MNKLLAIYGCLLLSSLSIADQQVSTVSMSAEKAILVKSNLETSFTALNIQADSDEDAPLYFMRFEVKKPTKLVISDIQFIEEDEIELGFDTSAYLPKDFDAYSALLTINSINYVELEDMNLGFDTSEYLPEGFDPYSVYFDVNSIIYIDNQLEYKLNFDSSAYLPTGFDAYSDNISVSAINYIENDQIDLGFDTTEYLPENFDPFKVSN